MSWFFLLKEEYRVEKANEIQGNRNHNLQMASCVQTGSMSSGTCDAVESVLAWDVEPGLYFGSSVLTIMRSKLFVGLSWTVTSPPEPQALSSVPAAQWTRRFCAGPAHAHHKRCTAGCGAASLPFTAAPLTPS